VIERERIEPDWTLGKLKDRFPGVELALYAFFGVGSRERSGFAASETLADLLRRHLIFDTDRACRRLDELAAEDWLHQIHPTQLLRQIGEKSVSVIDARSAEDFQRGHIPESLFLSAESVKTLKEKPSRPLVVVCNDGSQAPAASRHLRQLGFQARHLQGGLTAWSVHCDESFPINYPLEEIPGRWHLLADGHSLRFRREQPLPEQQWRVWRRQALSEVEQLGHMLADLPGLRLVAVGPKSFTARGELGELPRAAAVLKTWLNRWEVWNQGGEPSDQETEHERLRRVLEDEAPQILGSHKGTVEIESYEDRVLHLTLGGGCAGCASARITTQRELAAALYREVPLLDGIIGKA
jgi:rhodanese-related sulfurtransferase/Fe-S cluster biogenesis protein NfuA